MDPSKEPPSPAPPRTLRMRGERRGEGVQRAPWCPSHLSPVCVQAYGRAGRARLRAYMCFPHLPDLRACAGHEGVRHGVALSHEAQRVVLLALAAHREPIVAIDQPAAALRHREVSGICRGARVINRRA